MASTASQILDAIRSQVEAITVPDDDRAHPDDRFVGTIGPLSTDAQDRFFALMPSIPDRVLRNATCSQEHGMDVDLVVAYALVPEAWARATDDGSLIVEALWSCIPTITDLQNLEIQPGRFSIDGSRLLAVRPFHIEWRRA